MPGLCQAAVVGSTLARWRPRLRRRWRVRMQSAAIDWWIRFLVYPAPSVELATTRIARGQATFGPVPLHNLASAVDLQVRERSGSGTIVGRVVSTPLSDRGVRVPVAGGCCVQQVRATAQAELEGAPPPNQLTDAEVYAMIDSLGDVGTALADATRRA
jgi:hypothetical protein